MAASNNASGSAYQVGENFPILKIDPKDFGGSWKKFLNKFTIASRFATCNRGKKKVNISGTDTWVNVFDDEMKLCALLNAIGSEGLQVLLAQGIDVASAELTLDQVLEALKKKFRA